jgi:hypothetical protein
MMMVVTARSVVVVAGARQVNVVGPAGQAGEQEP